MAEVPENYRQAFRPRTCWKHLFTAVITFLTFFGCSGGSVPKSAGNATDSAVNSKDESSMKDANSGGCVEYLCKMAGMCLPDPGQPSAPCTATDQSCQDSDFCKENGQCWAFKGACEVVAQPGQSCAATCGCKKIGWCKQQGDGRCVASADSDCAGSEACKIHGLCAVDPANSHCSQVSEAGCKASDDCVGFGRCHAGKSLQRCEPSSDADCAGSQACSLSGECTRMVDPGADGESYCGKLVSFDCGSSAGCAKSGYCTGSATRCSANSEADCAKSELCKTAGKCVYAPIYGQCVAPNGQCGP